MKGPRGGNKLNYKYTYKGERVVWLIDRHNNTIVKQYVWTYTNNTGNKTGNNHTGGFV